jgi:hypothetical protein
VLFLKAALTFVLQSKGDATVLTTILLGTCVSVQGIFVKRLANGFVVVRDGARTYSGRPISERSAA